MADVVRGQPGEQRARQRASAEQRPDRGRVRHAAMQSARDVVSQEQHAGHLAGGADAVGGTQRAQGRG